MSCQSILKCSSRSLPSLDVANCGDVLPYYLTLGIYVFVHEFPLPSMRALRYQICSHMHPYIKAASPLKSSLRLTLGCVTFRTRFGDSPFPWPKVRTGIRASVRVHVLHELLRWLSQLLSLPPEAGALQAFQASRSKVRESTRWCG